MVEKRTVQPESCEGCSRAHDCKKVYEQLGCAESPSIAWTVVLAFLLPLVVFIAALAGFGRLLEGVVGEESQMPLAAALALVVTGGVMLVVRVFTRRHQKH
ncbi:MAG: SoxR reducing system RseC family protein [Solirubrobacterales bacterium]